MNIYNRLNISFICGGFEYQLNPIDVNDYDDSIQVLTYFRHPNIKRGCIGLLDVCSCKGFDIKTSSTAQDQIDTYENVLLKNILVFSMEEGEGIVYQYTFLKN